MSDIDTAVVDSLKAPFIVAPRFISALLPPQANEAAQSMLYLKKWSWLKAWAMQIARRRGMKKAIVALARRLAIILHRIWVDSTEFRWTREVTAA